MEHIIEIENLVKRYGDTTVLKEISFFVNKGEVFGLLGINGAGKTTTIECMEGLRPYEQGTITLHGRIGIQLQSSSLPAFIRPLEAIQLFANWNNVCVNNDMLLSLGIPELGKTHYAALSTGQKRRLHLALALVSDPDIIFLDEPTAGLDVEGRIALHKHIHTLKQQGKTILLASHDMAEVEQLCDRIAIVNKGDITFLGTVDELSAKIDKRILLTITTKQGTQTYPTNTLAQTMLERLEDCKTKQIEVLDIKIERATLEQNFMNITKGDTL